jgi:hypothetical protein
MNKFKIIEDIFLADKKLISANTEIFFNDDNELVLESELGQIKLSKEFLKNKIKPVEDTLQVKISIVDDEDENVVKNWRLQLDFKSSRKKVHEIEEYLRKTLIEML